MRRKLFTQTSAIIGVAGIISGYSVACLCGMGQIRSIETAIAGGIFGAIIGWGVCCMIDFDDSDEDDYYVPM